MILLLACAPDPGPVVGPARLAEVAPPELPCPWVVDRVEVVGGAPVPGPEALRPADDHLWLGGRPIQVEGRIAEVDQDGDVVWVAARHGGLWALDAAGAPLRHLVLRSPVVAVDADGGEAWAVSADGEVLRASAERGELARTLVDGRPTGIRAAGEGAWVRGTDGEWTALGRPDPLPAPVERPPLPEPRVVVALEVGADGAVKAEVASEAPLPEELGWVDGLPWQPPVATARRGEVVAVGLAHLGRLVLVAPDGSREVHPLPGSMQDVRDPMPAAALRWDDDGLWIPLPRHGLARRDPSGGAPALLPGVPGAWDVSGGGPERVVALGDAGVGQLRDGALVGRCALPGRIVRVAAGPDATWAASRGVLYRLRPRSPDGS